MLDILMDDRDVIYVGEFLGPLFGSHFKILNKENFYFYRKDPRISVLGFSKFSLEGFYDIVKESFDRDFSKYRDEVLRSVLFNPGTDIFLNNLLSGYRAKKSIDSVAEIMHVDSERIRHLAWYSPGFVGKKSRSMVLEERSRKLRKLSRRESCFYDNIKRSDLKLLSDDVMHERISNILKVVDDEAVRRVDYERLNRNLMDEYERYFDSF